MPVGGIPQRVKQVVNKKSLLQAINTHLGIATW